MKLRITYLFLSFSLMGYSQNHTVALGIYDSVLIHTKREGIIMDSITWTNMGLDSIELFNHTFAYTLFQVERDKYSYAIVKRESSDEEIHWSCTINSNNKLIDWITSGYDNSEGFLIINSSLTNNELEVIEQNIYSKPETSKKIYVIGFDGTFKEI